MAVDSMQIQYTDLRQLINIDPPVYDYEADDDQYMVSLTGNRQCADIALFLLTVFYLFVLVA